MPKALHRKLSRQATKKGLKGKAKNRYVFGTMAMIRKARRKKK